MKSPGVSIVICCYNGAGRLGETIRHIAQQRVSPHIPWELLIVDNGSTDGSEDVARMEWQKHKTSASMRIVKEKMLGLTFARSCGFREAHYEYIILCDDDNWLEENYVGRAFEILSANANIGAAGGLGKLVYEIEPPVKELAYIFAGGPQAPQPGRVKENKVYGAGCVIRHSAYEKIMTRGFKSLLTDRKGAELSSGGDYELCLALAIVGYDIWYDDQLRFTHFITRERLTWDYFLRYAVESSKCFNVIESYKTVASHAPIHHLPWLAVMKDFLVCARTFVGTNFDRLLSSKVAIKRALYFRHLIFKNLVIAYPVKFRKMVKTHKMILQFQESCRASKRIYQPVEGKEYALRSGLLSFQNLRDRFHNVFGT